MNELKVLSKVIESKGGIKPQFTFYHVVKAMELLKENESLGRHHLMRELMLGEASVKTLIRRLKELKLVETSRPYGTRLTSLGLELVNYVNSLVKMLPELPKEGLCVKCRLSGVVVKEGSTLLTRYDVLKIRDLVVRHGAEGAVIILFKDSVAYMPTSTGEELVKDLKAVEHVLKSGYVTNNDLLIIAICGEELPHQLCCASAVNAVIDILVHAF